MTRVTPRSRLDGADPFATDAAETLAALRRECARVIGELPEPILRATQLGNSLEIDRNLAWKIWQVAAGHGSVPSPKHVPGRLGFRSFIRAARERGVSAETVESALGVFDRFEQLVRRHGGDRASADILLGQLTDEGRGRLEIELRRNAYRANGHFLGVQARVIHQADLVLPGARGFMPRVVRIHGHYGVRRLRAGTPWVLSRSTFVQPSGRVSSSQCRRSPLSGGSPLEPPLLREFCSTPVLGVRRRLLSGERCVDELQPGPVGDEASVDVVTGEEVSGVPREPVARDAVTAHLLTPCEQFWYEAYFDRSLLDGAEPTMDVYSTIHSDLPYAELEGSDRIPVPEQLMHAGPAETAPSIPDVPRHAELIEWTLQKCGVKASEIEVHRVSLRFPPVPSCVAVTYSLRPEAT